MAIFQVIIGESLQAFDIRIQLFPEFQQNLWIFDEIVEGCLSIMGGCISTGSIKHAEITDQSLHEGLVQFLFAFYDILVIKSLDEICKHLWLLPSFRVMLL